MSPPVILDALPLSAANRVKQYTRIGAYRYDVGKLIGIRTNTMKTSTPWHCASLFLFAMLAACSHAPDEQQVRDAIGAAASAVKQTDAGALADVLSEDFDGNRGELDRRRLVNMLRVQNLRGAKPGILLGPIGIEPRGERLVAEFTVTLSGGGRVLPDRLGVYTVHTAWKQEGGDWLCYSATWNRKL